jgi:hypothetical protein
LLGHPHFSLEVLLIQEEEVRRHDPTRAWRRKGWVTEERRLLNVAESHVFETPENMALFIPGALESPFTTRDLAEALGRPVWLARKIAYCLVRLDIIEANGKKGNAILYAR